MDESTLRAHAIECDAAYLFFDAVPDQAQRAALARLIDFTRAEQLRLPEMVTRFPDSLACLAAACEKAQPDRKCVQYILDAFPGWIEGVAEVARPWFHEGFPHLAPAARDLGDTGMRDVISAVNREPRTLPCIYAYSMTTAEAVRAVASLATRCELAALQKLAATVTVQMMEETKDAIRLLPALARVPQALALVTAIAGRNVSSAFGACRDLPRILANHAAPDDYLSGFQAIVEAIGIQAVGVCLSQLPRLYTDPGPQAARRFASAAVECARVYGSHAGQAFLERRTQAARQVLS